MRHYFFSLTEKSFIVCRSAFGNPAKLIERHQA